MGDEMLKRVLLAVTVVLGLLGLVPPAAHAALSCPIVLSHDTTLHQDLDCSSLTSGVAVDFSKSHLTLDLNGHKILGHVGSDSAYGVQTSYNNETIKNGAITNFRNALYSDYASGLVIKNVTAVADAADTNSEGFYIYYGANSVLQHDTASGFYAGFDLEYSGGNSVLNSTSNESSSYAFYTYYETADVFRNDTSNGLAGSTDGFYDGDYSNMMRYIRNTANGGDYGFYLDCDSYGAPAVIRGNTANNNTEDGFYLYDCYNSENYIQDGARITNNTANHNGADGFYDEYGPSELWKGNTANGNSDYGFNLYEPVNQVVRDNTANGNQSDSGFYLEDNESYYNVRTFAHNVANNNSNYGFYADYGAPGGGNHAAGNPSINCYQVRCG
jgi:parallel beta-helix repeat protein